jgi:CII-binding regulator of phage lambda lysogenization HflD
MYTKQEHTRLLNKQKRRYESILIDIIFNLLDIEDKLERNDFHPNDLQDRIKKIKENIGKELSD